MSVQDSVFALPRNTVTGSLTNLRRVISHLDRSSVDRLRDCANFARKTLFLEGAR
jgi:hypothetical protein